MTSIRIISGTYGHHENGCVCSKNRHSAPFPVDDNEAKRLVALGVAEFAVKGSTTVSTGIISTSDESGNNGEIIGNTSDYDENVDNDEDGTFDDEDDSENDAGDILYDETTPMSELRAIGKSMGLSLPVGMTKAAIIEALDSAMAASAPDLDAEEPVEM